MAPSIPEATGPAAHSRSSITSIPSSPNIKSTMLPPPAFWTAAGALIKPHRSDQLIFTLTPIFIEGKYTSLGAIRQLLEQLYPIWCPMLGKLLELAVLGTLKSWVSWCIFYIKPILPYQPGSWLKTWVHPVIWQHCCSLVYFLKNTRLASITQPFNLSNNHTWQMTLKGFLFGSLMLWWPFGSQTLSPTSRSLNG